MILRSLLRRARARVARFHHERRASDWQRLSAARPYVRYAVRPGVRLDLPASSDLSRYVYVDNLEGIERRLLASLLRPGDFFIDVGANFGLYTVDAANLVGPSGAVLAFEPSANAYENLCHNIALGQLTNVDARPMALSDQEGHAVLKVSRDGRDAWNTFGVSLHESAHEPQLVTTGTLDSILAARPTGVRPALIKIDVEGWEYHVVRGAAQLLGRDDAPLLQVEFAPAYFVANGLDIAILRDTIVSYGYELFLPTGARALRPHRRDDELAGNLYAAKRSGPWFPRFQTLLHSDSNGAVSRAG